MDNNGNSPLAITLTRFGSKPFVWDCVGYDEKLLGQTSRLSYRKDLLLSRPFKAKNGSSLKRGEGSR
jgi:hypothetical protein